MERTLLALSALPLNTALGGPRRFYAALGLTQVGRYPSLLIRLLETRLDREYRSSAARQERGLLLACIVALLSLFTGWLASKADAAHTLELLLLTIMLPVRPSWDCASQIRRALRAGDIAAARKALEDTAWRHHALLDEHALARAAIEILAVHFSEKIVAALFWYLIGGLPALCLSRGILLLHETLLRPGHTPRDFARAAHSAHFLLHYIPSRAAALLWLAAGLFLPSLAPQPTTRALLRAIKGDSPTALALRSAACMLNLSLGGPASAYGVSLPPEQSWVGDGTARASHGDIGRALYLFALLHLFLFLAVGLFL